MLYHTSLQIWVMDHTSKHFGNFDLQFTNLVPYIVCEHQQLLPNRCVALVFDLSRLFSLVHVEVTKCKDQKHKVICSLYDDASILAQCT